MINLWTIIVRVALKPTSPESECNLAVSKARLQSQNTEQLKLYGTQYSASVCGWLTSWVVVNIPTKIFQRIQTFNLKD